MNKTTEPTPPLAVLDRKVSHLRSLVGDEELLDALEMLSEFAKGSEPGKPSKSWRDMVICDESSLDGG